MDCFQEDSYKQIIRKRLGEVRLERPHVTMKYVAGQVPVQYTYFSKVMNDEQTHFSEDHLFAIGNILGLFPDEVEYMGLLRSEATSRLPSRKAHLRQRILRLQRIRTLHAKEKSVDENLFQDVGYLLDPLSMLVHVGLTIGEYQQNPRRLASGLGISSKKLQEILQRLSEMGYIVQNGSVIEKVNQSHIHFSADHPLMRTHQNLLRQISAAKLQSSQEGEKTSFMASFSTDAAGVEEIKKAFDRFIEKVEAIAVNSRDEFLYQLNFDCFRWC